VFELFMDFPIFLHFFPCLRNLLRLLLGPTLPTSVRTAERVIHAGSHIQISIAYSSYLRSILLVKHGSMQIPIDHQHRSVLSSRKLTELINLCILALLLVVYGILLSFGYNFDLLQVLHCAVFGFDEVLVLLEDEFGFSVFVRVLDDHLDHFLRYLFILAKVVQNLKDVIFFEFDTCGSKKTCFSQFVFMNVSRSAHWVGDSN